MTQPIVVFDHVDFAYSENYERRSIFRSFQRNKEQIQNVHVTNFHSTDINLEIYPGEVIGVIGRNGSGKSTFLKLCAKILFPNSGVVQVRGKISPMIELGAGFSMDFSAEENIRMYACLMGNRLSEVNSNIESIIKWAEIEGRETDPLRTYSTGMIGRVAFSTATAFNADLVLIDEVLSVGDESFRNKSEDRVKKIMTSGAAILLVSHDMNTIRRFTNRILFFKNGRLIYDGDPDTGINLYLDSINE